MPRWGWIAIGVGVLLPIVVIGLISLLVGFVLFTAVGAIISLTAAMRRLFHRPIDDGRRNVRIMVHSARVLDP
ncbi:MAG: hypothetical protein FWD61_15995 [Phycisphaerales bacterium]|nr:hypothetical protein [Phycisphaerales bacterium]